MRDPDGSIEFVDDRAVRTVHDPRHPAFEFLDSDCARQLVRAGSLVPFSIENQQVTSPRYPFITLPHEWCDAQVAAAGSLTLELSNAIHGSRYELKDASAWNVIFDGCRPVFCDHLSFRLIDDKYWWAFGQFVRHFVLTLGMSRECELRAYQAFLLFRDGVPQQTARNWLGARWVLTRMWPVLLSASSRTTPTPRTKPSTRSLHRELYRFADWLMVTRSATKSRSSWADYSDAQPHYSSDAQREKAAHVSRWTELAKPSWVLDVGCNTGVYSTIAGRSGAKVIAVDADHDCIQKLYLENIKSSTFIPMIANLGDLSGGRGWMGAEFPGAPERFREAADLVMLLAMIHHLTIAEGVPLDKVVDLVAHLTRRYAIVELVDSSDPVFSRMATQYQRSHVGLGKESQQAAFEKRFIVRDEHQLTGTARTMLLLERK
jgi:SAM-dependent methyltransferase